MMNRAICFVISICVGVPAFADRERPTDLVGEYDGGQMEMAASLELRENGRFQYGLSYGAMDEEADGVWRVKGNDVLLTSDPVKSPQFIVVDATPVPHGVTSIDLQLPEGLSRQYFSAVGTMVDGQPIDRQFSDDAPLDLSSEKQLKTLQIELAVYNVRSPPLPLPVSGGVRLHVRFEANDLGKVAFANSPLRIEGKDLVFERYGRTVVFRRH